MTNIQNLQIPFFILLLSLIVNYLISSNSQFISKITGLIDEPDFKRKIHKKKTPLTASFSIVVLFLIFIVVNLYINLFDQNIKKILITSLCFFIIGLVDDKFNLKPYKKFILLFLPIFFILKDNSFLIIDKIFFYETTSFFYLNQFSFLFTSLCILALINAINLSDGINGLAAGIVFFCFFYILLLFNNNFNIFLIIILINILLIIPAIYKGDQFLGDSGSLFLSGFLSLIIIYYVNSYWADNINNNNWAEDIKIGSEHIFIILMIPGLDMLRLLIFRILKKKNPLLADREHLHHYLLKIYGLNKALIFYFLLMNMPIILSLYSNLSKTFLIAINLLVYSIFIFFLKKTSL